MEPGEDAPSGFSAGCSSVVDILRVRAGLHPDKQAYKYQEGDEQPEAISYGELLARSLGLATRLRELVTPPARVLIVLPPGLAYVVALFACMAAGVTAVPAYPPRPRRGAGALRMIAEDCDPAAVITDELIGRMLACPKDGLKSAPLVHVADASPVRWNGPWPGVNDLALLQYTSGSTGQPKGVMVRHGHILANLKRQQELYRASASSRAVIWLPPYHDMGLGSGILQPLYSDSSVLLMSPLHTLQRPFRWLRAIHETQATVSGGPPFAFAACIATVTPEERAGLDLSSWHCAFVGAEPISASVLENFAETFAECGFSRTVYQPSYGLAEATLLVTGQLSGKGARRMSAARGGPSRVSCGSPVRGHEVMIVDPNRLAQMPDGEVGEVWVRGPSVASGYWNDLPRTADVFGAHLSNGQGPYLRTGDLGLLEDGELCIVGRLKDIVIVAGRKLHAEDIESSVRSADPRLRDAPMATFGADVGDCEQLVLVVEMRRPERAVELESIVVGAIVRNHGVSPAEVRFVPPGSLPRTSSGKIRRQLARQRFEFGGEFEVAG